MSSFGRIFRASTFGESHCKSVGVVVDGCPPGFELCEADIQVQLDRRRPGQSKITTPRKEADSVTILSGVENGITLGTPIALVVNNLNTKPTDYQNMNDIPRPGHADYTYQMKYGLRASSGGGRASARETIGRVAAGSIAEKVLKETCRVEILSMVTSIGNVELPETSYFHPTGRRWTRDEVDSLGTLRLLRYPESGWNVSIANDLEAECRDESYFLSLSDEENTVPAYMDKDNNVFSRKGVLIPRSADLSLKVEGMLSDDIVPVRCPCVKTACQMITLVRTMKAKNDSIGGTAVCFAQNVPPGWGEPCFDKLEAMLAHAMLSLPAVKGFEIGSGFAGTTMSGSQHNDRFIGSGNQHLKTVTNNAGGTLGGISNGAEVYFKVAVKPVSSISLPQTTANFSGEECVLEAKGRHDPCVLPRVPPLLESMTALVLLDAFLLQKTR